jgi:signal transduction histidine kinase
MSDPVLLREKVYLNAILKNISDSLLLIGLDGTVLLINDSAQKALNIRAETLLNQKFWTHFPDDAFGFSMRESLTFGISHKVLYHKDNEISTSFIYEGPKSMHALLILFKDTREKSRLQEAACRKEQLMELGASAAIVSHEIKNPLGAMRGYASLLSRDLRSMPELQEMADLIIEGTKGLERVVSQILQFSKPQRVEIKTIDIANLLRQFGKFLKMDLAFPPNVCLNLHVPRDPLLVPVDPELLKSALLNLSLNAIQAMPVGGILSIALIKIETTYQIAISDTGVGMEEEELKTLFSPFFTTKPEGNGIGLVETKKIVQAHLGTIDVRSRPQLGTTFTLTLPLKR